MGIPSYFSFIVKNHGNIVRKLHRLNKNVDNFYLDSNSIVYDCLRALDKEMNIFQLLNHRIGYLLLLMELLQLQN